MLHLQILPTAGIIDADALQAASIEAAAAEYGARHNSAIIYAEEISL